MTETSRSASEHTRVRRFAIVFVDVAGSTRLYETAGDEMAKGLIVAIEDRIAGVVGRMGGEVQEIVGDEVMFRFQEVNRAASCAIAITINMCRS